MGIFWNSHILHFAVISYAIAYYIHYIFESFFGRIETVYLILACKL
jgi:hypothetical protein